MFQIKQLLGQLKLWSVFKVNLICFDYYSILFYSILVEHCSRPAQSFFSIVNGLKAPNGRRPIISNSISYMFVYSVTKTKKIKAPEVRGIIFHN